MNILTKIRMLNDLNDKELKLGIVSTKASWHNQYKDSAWVYIGGLPYELSEGDVICVMSQYGEVINVNLIRDKKTGKSKGFAFLCYQDQRSTILAVDNLNGAKIKGRQIKVDHVLAYKVPKEDDDIDEITKSIREEGVAPKPLLDSEEADFIEIKNEIENLNVPSEDEKRKKKKSKHKRKSETRFRNNESNDESNHKHKKLKKVDKKHIKSYMNNRSGHKSSPVHSTKEKIKSRKESRHKHESRSFPTCDVKLGTKSIKKWKRTQAKLFNDGVKITQKDTLVLAVSNAGLANGIKRSDLENILNPYTKKYMLFQPPKKSYAFVKFEEINCARNVYINLMGICLKSADNLATPSATLYMHFIEEIPIFQNQKESTNTVMNGLTLLENFITEKEHDHLMQFLNSEYKIHCNNKEMNIDLKNRHVWHYGYEFLYGTNDFDINKPLLIPEPIKELLPKLKINLTDNPNQITINKYFPGQGIPSHIDNPDAFNEDLFSLSLGSSVVMNFKHPSGTILNKVLKSKSLLLLQGDARYVWEHGITPRKIDLHEVDGEMIPFNRGERISITFRTTNKNYSRPSIQLLPTNISEAINIEKQHVHNVYNEIATHFSSTREKPWPKVKQFLESLQAGSLVLDVGCGSGRYLGIRKDICIIGCDRSESLIEICSQNDHNVFVCDGLNLCIQKNRFDACICIAVIHHYSTVERRVSAIEQLASTIKVGGRMLLYVWALEQEIKKVKSKYLKEIKHDTVTADVQQVNKPQNLICIHENRTKFKQQDMYVPWHKKNANTTTSSNSMPPKTFHRYYHVFKEGELCNIMNSIKVLKLINIYYDDGNWCAVAEKI